jgi:hypothetical protein
MHWFKIVLIGFCAISAVSNIALIGAERKLITRGVAAVSIIINALLITRILYYF